MGTSSVIASPLSDKLKQQQNSLQQNQTNYKNAQNKIQQLESKIESFDNQIEGLMREIQENKSKISSLQNDINRSQKEIVKAKKDIKEEQELYNQRMRAMYMNGVGGYLEVILGAENLGDLFQKIEAVKKLSDLDKKIVKQLRNKQENLQAKQDKLKSEQNKVVNLNKAQQEKVSKLEQDKKAQRDVMAQAQKESQLYAGKLQSDQSQINATMKLIEQIKKQAEAARIINTTVNKSQSNVSMKDSKVSSSNSNSSTSRNSNTSSSRTSRGNSINSNYSGNAVVAYASNFQGAPYQWGATGPNTFDCSGFTSYVYAHFGVGLPRTSGDQSGFGTYVDRKSTRLNSSHANISYAVFCLKKKKKSRNI